MLSQRLIRQSPRLVTATHLRYQPLPRPRFSSTESSKTSSSSAMYAGVVSFAAGLGTGWALYRNGNNEKPITSSSSPATTQTPLVPRISTIQTPDLNELGIKDEIAYTAPPTRDDVTKQLNEHKFTVRGAPGGVDRYDGAQLASNSPCEDAFMHGSFSSPFGGSGDDRWMAWAVFDGHCGWQLSNLLKTQLMPFVRRSLADANPADKSEVTEDAVHQALKNSFTALDDALVKSATAIIESDLPFAEKARRLEPAYAGACALLTLFDPQSRKLHVASTGDCRAVLGQKAEDGKWVATALSTDCTGATPSEIERIKAQFPDEPNVVQGGRVWGLQPSRTLGDGMWKWTATLKQKLRHHYNGLALPSATRYKDYKEGPYVTAEPLVTTTQIPSSKEGRPSFLILATDGLWDTMSSAQAVDLVGRWCDRQQKGAQAAEPEKPAEDFGPVILGWKQQCKYEERKATFRDDNAAVHLMRNGLGGADEEMVRGALAFRYPNSRDIRDDITIQVVFFGPV
ncbi:phosphatase 2C-like domain-containing protein [Xylaria bambusicola]|uniref:phosphatase 2C-like domain-containing protein n=1 Tax=Xylaria bambusicola TaxID=326684 RepID=UPI002007B686|nr:phosphatase 2C-like domain-containing protein [Xylaria bambusicola]KAI0527892.1 phosphatase 2C-like domain-containing protein [Xylaria bambusicola]